MEPIKRIIPGFIRGHGFSNQLKVRRVIENAFKILPGLWGEERAAHIQFVSFKEGVLKAEAISAPAMQQLNLEKTRFINELNRSLGEKTVKDLYVRSKGF